MDVVDLFCGAGGFSLGLHQAHHRVIAAFDFEPAALAVHEANLRYKPNPTFTHPFHIARYGGKHADLGAVAKWIPHIGRLEPDVIVGGPPCQPFSKQGKQLGDEDERAIHTLGFASVVAAVRPRYFVMENVPALRKYKTFDEAVSVFRTAGYGLTIRTLRADKFGSSQKRARLIIAGCQNETDGWLNEYLVESHAERSVSIADLLSDEFGPLLFRRGHTNRRSFMRSDEQAFTIVSTSRRHTETDYVINKADLPVLRSVGDAITALGFAKDHELKVGDVIPAALLPIPSCQQMAVLAGFPATYNWSPEFQPTRSTKTGKLFRPRVPNDTELMKMIGNSVSPPFARALGMALEEHRRRLQGAVRSKAAEVHASFDEWLADRKTMAQPDITVTRGYLQRALGRVAARGLRFFQDEVEAFKIVSQRPYLAKDPELPMMREAMQLYYEWGLSLQGLGLEDTYYDPAAEHEQDLREVA